MPILDWLNKNQAVRTAATVSGESRKTTLAEHATVRLRQTMACEGVNLPAGLKGTVVSVYGGGTAYAIEFCDGLPEMSVVTVPAAALESLA